VLTVFNSVLKKFNLKIVTSENEIFLIKFLNEIMNEEIIPLYDECVICYDSILQQEYIEPCKHPVHIDCFLLTRKNTCPMCRQLVTSPRVFVTDYKLLKKMQYAFLSVCVSVYVVFVLWYYYTNGLI